MIDNKYQLTKLIGLGGSSRVYEATDDQGNKVAIKTIRREKNYKKQIAVNMMKREYDILQKLSAHPNVVNVLDYNYDGKCKGESGNQDIIYNVLEYAENNVLGRFVRVTGAIEEKIARLLIIQILDAIKFLHQQDYVHLDIKLENILLDGLYNIKVADLGSCLDVSQTKGYSNVKRGTTNYMAPEVSNQKTKRFDGKAADIYSLGVSFYLLLTGEFPHENEMEDSVITCGSEQDYPMDVEMADESEPIKTTNLSKEVKILLQAMLSRDPSKRPDINQILDYSWCSAPFEEGLTSEAYTEMEYRRKYIQEYYLAKQKL